MKYNNFLKSLLLFLLMVSCSATKKVIKETETLRKEAKAFTLSVVEIYFTDNCDKLYNLMNDSLLVMDGDGILSKVSIEEKLCKSMKSAVYYKKEKTFQDYLRSYEIEILTRDELVKKFKKDLPEYYTTTNHDFFFLGYKLKEGINSSDNFIWDDMFIFMVRKENNTWTIKGISG